jgi:hypothetical protein
LAPELLGGITDRDWALAVAQSSGAIRNASIRERR